MKDMPDPKNYVLAYAINNDWIRIEQFIDGNLSRQMVRPNDQTLLDFIMVITAKPYIREIIDEKSVK